MSLSHALIIFFLAKYGNYLVRVGIYLVAVDLSDLEFRFDNIGAVCLLVKIYTAESLPVMTFPLLSERVSTWSSSSAGLMNYILTF